MTVPFSSYLYSSTKTLLSVSTKVTFTGLLFKSYSVSLVSVPLEVLLMTSLTKFPFLYTNSPVDKTLSPLVVMDLIRFPSSS